jgi:hypothetical protein
MANVVIEFDVKQNDRDLKACRFTIRDIPDEHVLGLAHGDEIGFDLIESKEFFYVNVSRKVYLVGHQQPIFVICIPYCFNSREELDTMLDKFKQQFADTLAIDVD